MGAYNKINKIYKIMDLFKYFSIVFALLSCFVCDTTDKAKATPKAPQAHKGELEVLPISLQHLLFVDGKTIKSKDNILLVLHKTSNLTYDFRDSTFVHDYSIFLQSKNCLNLDKIKIFSSLYSEPDKMKLMEEVPCQDSKDNEPIVLMSINKTVGVFRFVQIQFIVNQNETVPDEVTYVTDVNFYTKAPIVKFYNLEENEKMETTKKLRSANDPKYFRSKFIARYLTTKYYHIVERFVTEVIIRMYREHDFDKKNAPLLYVYMKKNKEKSPDYTFCKLKVDREMRAYKAVFTAEFRTHVFKLINSNEVASLELYGPGNNKDLGNSVNGKWLEKNNKTIDIYKVVFTDVEERSKYEAHLRYKDVNDESHDLTIYGDSRAINLFFSAKEIVGILNGTLAKFSVHTRLNYVRDV